MEAKRVALFRRRNINIDVLRAAAIYGVVLIHTSTSSSRLGLSGYALVSLSRAAVPFFLVLFGFFLEKSLQRRNSAWPYLCRRFKDLFVPFLFWTLVYYLFYGDWRHASWWFRLSHCFSGYAWPGQYFFIILFQIILLAPLLRWVAESWPRVIAIILITLLLYAYGIAENREFPLGSHLAIRPFVYWMVYPAWGMFLVKRPQMKLASPLAILVLAAIPLEAAILDHARLPVDPYLRPGVLLASLVTVTFALNRPGSHRERSQLLAPIDITARNTLAIFLLNPLWLRIVLATGIVDLASRPFLQTPIHLVSAALVVALCLLSASIARLIGLSAILPFQIGAAPGAMRSAFDDSRRGSAVLESNPPHNP